MKKDAEQDSSALHRKIHQIRHSGFSSSFSFFYTKKRDPVPLFRFTFLRHEDDQMPFRASDADVVLHVICFGKACLYK